MVTKKNRSLRTMGPISAISSREEGSTPFSESSCSPEMINCAATKNRMTVVTRKNFCRLMRTLPLTNITPNRMATITPDNVPRKLSSSVEFSDTAPRIRTVSTPSRRTIRKTNRNSPKPAFRPARRPTLPSICPLSARPVFIMKTIMVMTKKAATSMIQPSKMSWFHWVRESRMAIPMLPTKAAIRAAKTDLRSSGRPILAR